MCSCHRFIPHIRFLTVFHVLFLSSLLHLWFPPPPSPVWVPTCQSVSISSPHAWPPSSPSAPGKDPLSSHLNTFFGEATCRVGFVLLLVSLLSLSTFLTFVTLTYKYLFNLMSLFLDHRLLDSITVFILFNPILQVQCLTHKKYTINICLTNTDDYLHIIHHLPYPEGPCF